MESVCGERIPFRFWEQRKKAVLCLRLWFITSRGNWLFWASLFGWEGGGAEQWWPTWESWVTTYSESLTPPATVCYLYIFNSWGKALRVRVGCSFEGLWSELTGRLSSHLICNRTGCPWVSRVCNKKLREVGSSEWQPASCHRPQGSSGDL